ITDDESECYVPAGYPGKAGELWFVRLCPPIGAVDYHVVFTTPYILTGFGKADWTAYLSKSLIGLTAPEKRRRLHEFLKYGGEAGRPRRVPEEWPEGGLRDRVGLQGVPPPPPHCHLPGRVAQGAGELAPAEGPNPRPAGANP